LQTEAQVVAQKKKRDDDIAGGEIETLIRAISAPRGPSMLAPLEVLEDLCG